MRIYGPKQHFYYKLDKLRYDRARAHDNLILLLSKFGIKDEARTLMVTSVDPATNTITVSWR